MAGLEPTHVVVAGTGSVYVAPEGSAPPVDLAAPIAPWEDIGYITEDGVQFTFSREQEEVNAWQAVEPVRVLVTNEPKTIAFDLLEFDRTSILLAFRGGSFTGTAPYTYTPPAAGGTDVRAMVIDGRDGASTFRFVFPRVSLSGDVAFALLRTDAVKPTLEFSVLASATPWSIISDLPGFTVAGLMSEGMPSTHAELDEAAEAAGVTWSSSQLTVAEKQAELANPPVPA